jgi:hypothetical protein
LTRAEEEGHVVAHHTYDHESIAARVERDQAGDLTVEAMAFFKHQIVDNIAVARQYLPLKGLRPYLRPPYLALDEAAATYLQETYDMYVVQINVDTKDYQAAATATSIERMFSDNLYTDSDVHSWVALQHDTAAVTAAAIPNMVAFGKGLGYRFVGIDECLGFPPESYVGVPSQTPGTTPTVTPIRCDGEPCLGENECRSRFDWCGTSDAHCLDEPTWVPACAPTTESPSTIEPSTKPTARPIGEPTGRPVPDPTTRPTVEPTVEPTGVPTVKPTTEPTVKPTAEPTAGPTVVPTAGPTVEPTVRPTAEPTAKPTVEPTARPTVEPTAGPTVEPTVRPTAEPTARPTVAPTIRPTAVPTSQPTGEPTTQPTMEPTTQPTMEPATQPTMEPTTQPTMKPTTQPTMTPTTQPTGEPTTQPTMKPTTQPTLEPTAQPVVKPTGQPTSSPAPIRCDGDQCQQNGIVADSDTLVTAAIGICSLGGAALIFVGVVHGLKSKQPRNKYSDAAGVLDSSPEQSAAQRSPQRVGGSLLARAMWSIWRAPHSKQSFAGAPPGGLARSATSGVLNNSFSEGV